MPRTFRSEPLLEIVGHVLARIEAGDDAIEIEVADPDLGRACYAGEAVRDPSGASVVHRPLRAWVDLAQRLELRLCTPREVAPGRVRLRFEALSRVAAWTARADADADDADATERYGAASGYRRVNKAEDPAFVLDLKDALERAALPPAPRILDLGANTGDGIALVRELLFSRAPTFVGVDHSASAIAAARARFGDRCVEMVEADLADLPGLALEPFDLVLAIGTLQSPGVDDRALLRHVVQNLLRPRASVSIAVPNCKYQDGELLHGGRTKNFRQPELGLLVRDVEFYRRYLAQHRRRVYVTGTHYVLVTGVPA